MANGDILKETFVKATNEDVPSSSTMSDFELTVAAATAAAQKTAAALMAAHAPANTCQNVANKEGAICLKPSNIPNGRSTFVIPKNKLLGSLIPINHNCPTKVDLINKDEDSEKKPKRKTKWGPDPRDDPIVKRGLALALQVSDKKNKLQNVGVKKNEFIVITLTHNYSF